jgi:NAD(P)-dependent dehydrogenase (short-subunit alcohol dehydrogenase family)
MPGVIIVGVGPGIGATVARRFAREGLVVGLIARSREPSRLSCPPWPAPAATPTASPPTPPTG